MVYHERPHGLCSPGGSEDGGTKTIRLGTSSAAAFVHLSVKMPPGANHAIFAFKVMDRGTHAIYVSVGGEFIEG